LGKSSISFWGRAQFPFSKSRFGNKEMTSKAHKWRIVIVSQKQFSNLLENLPKLLPALPLEHFGRAARTTSSLAFQSC
jgi:hypothetical protein